MSETTETRFANLELDLPGDELKSADPIDAPIVGETILEPARELAEKEEALAESALGVVLPTEFYAKGTKMMADGEAVARGYAREFKSRNLTAIECADAKAAITAENRTDVEVPLKDLTVDDRGVLVGPDNLELELTEQAFRQLSSHAMVSVPKALRGNVNLWLPRSRKVLKARTRDKRKGRLTPAKREMFALVTDKYTPFDIDEVAGAIAETLGKDDLSRAVFKYDGSKAKFDVCLNAEYSMPDELAVGRVHRVGARIETADDGTSGIWAKLYAERISCINCTILKGDNCVFYRKHVGSVDECVDLFKEAMGYADVAIAQFAELWGMAGDNVYKDTETGEQLSASEAMKRLVGKGLVHVPYVKGGALLSKLEDAWNVEPGDSVQSVNRAITRMAHSESWKSKWYTEEVEEQAGELLYNRVYSLDSLTDKEAGAFN